MVTFSDPGAARWAGGRRLDVLPAALWLGLPLTYLAAILFGRAMGDDFYDRWFYGELGIVELSTTAMALAAAGIAFAAWRRRAALPRRFLGWWLMVFALGALYFGGEEASWGQHLVGWGTPESIKVLNDHGETNLHNITNWADEKPKQLVDAAATIGGVLLPLFLLWRRVRFRPDDWRGWFLPTFAVFPACLIAVVLKNFERLRDALDWYPEGIVDMRMSEPQEMYFAMFFLIYTLSFYLRLRRQAG